jgi:hypothetical protein
MSTSEDKNPDICLYFDRENIFAQNSEHPIEDQGGPNEDFQRSNSQPSPDPVFREELQRESEERFSRYLQDRSQFPAPMHEEAYHGIAGQIVSIMSDHCESSRESLLFQFLVAAGNIMGKSVCIYAGGSHLYPNEFAICVGDTSRGRKGTAWRINEHLFKQVAPEWVDGCVISDIQSGEGIVYSIRDESEDPQKTNRRRKTSKKPQPESDFDPGVSDKRKLCCEEEISSTLKMAKRQGNTLTEIYRKAWDSPSKLQTLNKNSPLTASDPHISLIGHSNKDEILATFDKILISNGFANRFLWCASKRSKLLPNAEYLDWNNHPDVIAALKEAFRQRFANIDEPFRFYRTQDANALWEKIYYKLNNQKHVSFLDGVLVRDTSHLLKLAMIYAVLDKTNKIETIHLEAALAVCDYSQASARWLFAEHTGNPLANAIYRALLRELAGLSKTQISNQVCYRNTPSSKLDEALEALAKNGLAKMTIQLGEKGVKIEQWSTSRIVTPS